MDGGDLQKKSLHLYDVLDAVGASEYIRNNNIDNATTREICNTLLSSIAWQNTIVFLSHYTFGSSFEATLTTGLRSDQDHLLSHNYPPVIDTVEGCSQFLDYFLIVTDETTNPGYARLQLVRSGEPQEDFRSVISSLEFTDHEGRTYAKHLFIDSFAPLATVRNGPADSIINYFGIGSSDTDFVLAYRCRTIPSMANMWIHKEHPYNWPSRVQIQKMSTFGCFFVGKGHPKSKNPSIEWRISFSLQERYLMLGLNTTQHKCYIFLKMIKNDIIHHRTGNSISSYHCKTCLFYTIENTQSSFWIPKNLIQATRLCIVKLLQWTNEKNCPNFFVPDENMFDRLKNETLKQVAVVLKNILSSGMEFISWIKCDIVGDLFVNTTHRLYLAIVKEANSVSLGYYYDKLYMYTYCSLRNVFLDFLFGVYESQEERHKGLFNLLQILENTDRVAEHTRDEVRRALDPVLPHVHLQIAQSLAAQMVSVNGSENAATISDFKHHINKAKDSDHISSKLVMATHLLQHDMFEECELTLRDSEINLKPFVNATCACEKNEKPLINQDLSGFYMEVVNRKFVTFCMVFLPSQACLVHPALRYELFRSAFLQQNIKNYWFNWMVVDSSVYFFFLLYVLYSKTDKPALKQKALDSLLHLRFNEYLGHRDTLYNLLGWIYFQENKIQDAFVNLSHSWKLRPNHNAAKWHLVMFCYMHYKSYTT